MPQGLEQELVLVAEDDASNRALLSRLLERGGYRSIAVSDGRDAIKAAVDEAPDLLLLDVGLPSINGLDVCRRLAVPGNRPRDAPRTRARAAAGERGADAGTGAPIGPDRPSGARCRARYRWLASRRAGAPRRSTRKRRHHAGARLAGGRPG